MRKRLSTALALAVLLVCFTASGSSAATIYFTDRAVWASAVSGVTTETYDSYAWTGSGGDLLSSGGSVTLGGITYSFGDDIFGVGSTLNYDAAYHTTNYLEWQYSPGPFTITLPSAVTAVSFDLGEFYGNVRTLSIALGNGDSTSVVSANNAYVFWGAVSDTPFSTLTLNWDRDYGTIDNLSYAGPRAVPDPGSSLLLLGLGLVGLGVWRRR